MGPNDAVLVSDVEMWWGLSLSNLISPRTSAHPFLGHRTTLLVTFVGQPMIVI